MKIGWIPTLAGAGATSVMLEVALELGARSQAVTLIDADPVAEVSARTQSRPRAPLSDVFAWSEKDVTQSSAVPLHDLLAIVPADGGRFVGSGLALSPRVLAACAKAYEARGAVFVDLPPAGAPATSVALSVLDGVVGVVPATAAGIRSVAAFLRLVLGARAQPGPPPALLALVIAQTRAGEISDEIARELGRCTGALVPTIAIPWDPDLERASTRRLLHRRSRPELAQAISALVDVLARAPRVPEKSKPDAGRARPTSTTSSSEVAHR